MPDQDSVTPQPGREPRSRHDRPCDVCRRHKHLCMIPVRGEPCVSCAARKKDCTFDMPPTARKRKPKANANLSPITPGHQPNNVPSAAKSRQRITDYQDRRVFSTPLGSDRPEPSPSSTEMDRGLPQAGAGHNNSSLRLEDNSRPILFSSGTPLGSREGDEADDNPLSLDPGEGEDEESHFVGTRSFFGLMLKEGCEGGRREKPNTTFERLATLAFRQVSADPRLPAYFIKHPSLLYGRGQNTSKSAFQAVWDLCAKTGPNIVAESMDKIKTITLPALPFISSKPIDLTWRGLMENKPVPYALLAGMVAHTTIYIPQIAPLHKDLWSQVLLAVEDEYRQPRLRTIQLALMILTSRPSENTGQSEIGLSRAVGAAHLLGLHIDPTHWNLPRWERSIRKRLWWTLLIHDKWRALLYGRPSNLHDSDYSVTVPSLYDADAGTDASRNSTASFESFIATCQLTLIIDKLLKQFYTVQALAQPVTGLTRIAALEAIREELLDFEQSLPPGLRHVRGSRSESLPTGVRSFQLSFYGILVVTNRLSVDSMADRPGALMAIGLQNALEACEELTDLVLRLTEADMRLFWMPYSSHHISNTVSLLLQVALSDRQGQLCILDSAVSCTKRLIDWLVYTYPEPSWDISEAALRRIATLLLIASRELPQLNETYQSVATVLNLPLNNGASTTTADQLLESLGQNLEPADWLQTDLSWLNADFLAIPDGSGIQPF